MRSCPDVACKISWKHPSVSRLGSFRGGKVDLSTDHRDSIPWSCAPKFQNKVSDAVYASSNTNRLHLSADYYTVSPIVRIGEKYPLLWLLAAFPASSQSFNTYDHRFPGAPGASLHA